ncbi:hypothetical protein Xcel_2193 [Xylanimonas cellulosilytica DSM 15894]|uniref:Uncharacterized protein n=1 Tax=Xylanimonas cellulosilytica (strain DSM 15894 / JCM 12276 / CECT 5975 / KCTC 9989 / LMG 20990 / NBRC 107835 / XIL07) TaxID=446471 RepID=D1BUX2_XYLCX|nr:hypothetical protein [Xylanimonas cellulosilytica]ACZ31211.1 hypothetical protein Xcel_2193 [Xylanimonas cellulosilytica DSM 15894]
MTNTPRTSAFDSLTFYDLYRADQEQLERRLAQIQIVRELRAERRKLAAERGDAVRSPSPATPSRLRRRLRALVGRSARPTSHTARVA